MYLGIIKRATISLFFLAFASVSVGQTVKSHKYLFDNELQGNNILINDNSLLINYSAPELSIESIILIPTVFIKYPYQDIFLHQNLASPNCLYSAA